MYSQQKKHNKLNCCNLLLYFLFFGSIYILTNRITEQCGGLKLPLLVCEWGHPKTTIDDPAMEFPHHDLEINDVIHCAT